jgi:VanZ family protein
MGDDLNGFALNHGPVAHFVAYFVLAGLLFLITMDFESLPLQKCAFNSWAIAGIFATMIEFGQYLVPDRTFDLNDIWFNLIAAGLGSVSLFLVNKKQAGKTVS